MSAKGCQRRLSCSVVAVMAPSMASAGRRGASKPARLSPPGGTAARCGRSRRAGEALRPAALGVEVGQLAGGRRPAPRPSWSTIHVSSASRPPAVSHEPEGARLLREVGERGGADQPEAAGVRREPVAVAMAGDRPRPRSGWRERGERALAAGRGVQRVVARRRRPAARRPGSQLGRQPGDLAGCHDAARAAGAVDRVEHRPRSARPDVERVVEPPADRAQRAGRACCRRATSAAGERCARRGSAGTVFDAPRRARARTCATAAAASASSAGRTSGSSSVTIRGRRWRPRRWRGSAATSPWREQVVVAERREPRRVEAGGGERALGGVEHPGVARRRRCPGGSRAGPGSRRPGRRRSPGAPVSGRTRPPPRTASAWSSSFCLGGVDQVAGDRHGLRGARRLSGPHGAPRARAARAPRAGGRST